MMAQSKTNGSHYALTAIGLGMLVLGVIMAMWNLVPGFSSGEKPTAQGSNKTETGSGILKSKTFSVAYVLVGAGVMLLLLSICLSIRDKRKQRQGEEMARIQHLPGPEPHAPEEDSQEEEEEEEASSRYYVPSYEEVMNTNFSEARGPDHSPRLSISLPSYESLTGLDETSPTTPRADVEGSLGHPPERQNSKLAKRLKPLKVRRIKSEKLHLKDFRINLPDKNVPPPSIEPLTPPPQYDEVQEKAPNARPPD